MTEPANIPPFAVLHIDHLVFRVTDLERSIAFYGEVLGCAVVKRRDDLGLVHLRAGSAMIDLVSIDGRLGKKGGDAPGAGARNVDHLCLRIEPFDEQALIRHLASHKLEPTEPISDKFGAEGFGPSLYINDPDGNVVELKGPPGASTPGKAG
jgi:catechol 2,3-dioxygenase-like lactoylglutathione lyase family enzyme